MALLLFKHRNTGRICFLISAYEGLILVRYQKSGMERTYKREDFYKNFKQIQ